MGKREITRAIVGTCFLGAPVAGLAQTGWVPGTEITGQSVQVETNGVTNTVFFDPGGVARIQTPNGNIVPGTWAAANGQLCLTTGAAQECWPYAQPFQAGQQITLTSSCNSASRWTALARTWRRPSKQAPANAAKPLALVDRREQRELRDGDVERRAVLVDHPIASAHRAGRRVERAARDIVEASAGRDQRHFADHALAPHFVHRAAPVDDLSSCATAIAPPRSPPFSIRT